MIKYFIEHYTHWVLSVSMHLIMVLSLIYFANISSLTQDLPAIAVNIISSNDISPAPNIVKQKIIAPNKNKLVENAIDDRSAKQSNIVQKTQIKDISYSPNLYKIGSKNNPIPPYPRMAKLRNYQGVVKVMAIVDYQGKIIEINLQQSSGYNILDNAAIKTIQNWSFDLKKHNLPLTAYYKILIPINFQINSN